MLSITLLRLSSWQISANASRIVVKGFATRSRPRSLSRSELTLQKIKHSFFFQHAVVLDGIFRTMQISLVEKIHLLLKFCQYVVVLRHSQLPLPHCTEVGSNLKALSRVFEIRVNCLYSFLNIFFHLVVMVGPANLRFVELISKAMTMELLASQEPSLAAPLCGGGREPSEKPAFPFPLTTKRTVGNFSRKLFPLSRC